MSHFHISKKFWKPWRKPANLPYFRLPAPISQKFDMVSRTFLKYKNGSNFFYDLLRPLLIHTVLPHIFEKSNHPSEQCASFRPTPTTLSLEGGLFHWRRPWSLLARVEKANSAGFHRCMYVVCMYLYSIQWIRILNESHEKKKGPTPPSTHTTEIAFSWPYTTVA